MSVLTFTTNYTLIACGQENCSARFAVPTPVYERWRSTHENWYCPNGHCRHFTGKPALEVEREKSARLATSLVFAEQQRNQARDEAEHFRKSRDATKGALTKVRRRTGCGVCPVEGCHHTVKQLAAHMKAKHPGYAKS